MTPRTQRQAVAERGVRLVLVAAIAGVVITAVLLVVLVIAMAVDADVTNFVLGRDGGLFD